MTRATEQFDISFDAPVPAYGVKPIAVGEDQSARLPATASGRWSLGLIGLLMYLVIEYGNLLGIFPVLQPFQVGKIAVFLAAAGYLLSRGTERVSGCARSYDQLLWGLIFAAALGAVFAEHQALAWSGILDAVRWWGVFFIISRALNTNWRIRTFVFVWLLLDLKLALHVVRAYATLSSMPGINEMILVSHGISAGSSFLLNSADFGVAMCVAWPIAVWLLLSRPKAWYKLLVLAGAPLFLAAILVCGSRGAVVGAVAIVLVALLRNPTKIAAALMLLSLAVGIWLVLPQASKERFESARNPEQDLTAHHRLLLWKAGLEMFGDSPLVGVGINNYPLVRREHYRIALFDWIASVPHSTYIQAISELGITGTLPLLLLWLQFFRLNARTRRAILSQGPGARRTFEFGLATALDLSMVGYMAAGAFVAVLWYPHLFLLFGLSSALHSVCAHQQDHVIQLTNRVENQPQLAW